MEYDKQLEATISQALLQVEKDLFLPQNTLVDTLPKDHSPYRPERKKIFTSVPGPKLHGKSAWQMYKTFQGAKTPQKSCRARRDDLAPHEWGGRTSGPVGDHKSKNGSFRSHQLS